MATFRHFIETLSPTTNQAYKVGRLGNHRGVIYMTSVGKAWKLVARQAIRAANSWPPDFWRNKRLYVSLVFLHTSTLTYDIDGRIKLTLDAIADGLGFDDRYVYPLYCDKAVGPVPGVSVLVTDRIPDAPGRPKLIGELGTAVLRKGAQQ